MKKANIVKNMQEQAVASWGNYLNYLRFNELAERLAKQDINFEKSFEELEKLKMFISSPKNILGCVQTKHGEIAEHIQVHGENAANLILGNKSTHTFDGVGRLAKEDYLGFGKMIQSKFYNNVDTTFRAINIHLETYPEFVIDGGSYDIPKDQYEVIIDIYRRGETMRSSLRKTALGNEETLYKNIKAWEANKGVRFDEVVNPTRIDYKDSQLNALDRTVKNEENSVRKTDKKIRDKAQFDTKPTFDEGLKVVAVAAVAEAGVTFCLKVHKLRKEGKKLSDFSDEDWKDIGIDTGIGGIKGGIRGGTIYVLSNFAGTPTPVANALVTATFGMLTQANLLRQGKITASEFVENSEVLCMEVSISSLSAIAGEIIIPIPFLGAIIGNAVGMFMYNIAFMYLSEQEQRIIKDYIDETVEYQKQLEANYQVVLQAVEERMMIFRDISDLAFDEDVNVRLDGSITFARYLEVDEASIIKSEEDAEAIFCSREPVVLG
jgi:hypothetical protein